MAEDRGPVPFRPEVRRLRVERLECQRLLKVLDRQFERALSRAEGVGTQSRLAQDTGPAPAEDRSSDPVFHRHERYSDRRAHDDAPETDPPAGTEPGEFPESAQDRPVPGAPRAPAGSRCTRRPSDPPTPPPPSRCALRDAPRRHLLPTASPDGPLTTVIGASPCESGRLGGQRHGELVR